MEFKTQEEFSSYLVERLQTSLSPLECNSITNDIAGDFCELRMPSMPAGSFGLVVPVMRWIIRDDDLKLLDSIVDGCKAALITGWLVGTHTDGGVLTGSAGVLCAVLKLARQALKKGRRLSRFECQLLVALKTAPHGLKEPELLARVDLMTKHMNDPGALTETLRQLSAVALADGTVVSMVSRDADQLWRAAGV